MPKVKWNSEGYTIRYKCPQCEHSHVINVGIDEPGLPKWKFNGDFDYPTLEPSVNIEGKCHHYITLGRMQFCNDPANRMTGSIELEEI